MKQNSGELSDGSPGAAPSGGGVPFKIPLPPPVQHSPPPALRMPPRKIMGKSTRTLPPTGARVPGDRTNWSQQAEVTTLPNPDLSAVERVELSPDNWTRPKEDVDSCNAAIVDLGPTKCMWNKGSFELTSGQHVAPGDWIRDKNLGLGKILELHTDTVEDDRHRLWFPGINGGGQTIEGHALLPNTLGTIHQSMIPDIVRKSAPNDTLG